MVEVDIFIGAFWGVRLEKSAEPFDRGSLADASGADFVSREVVGDKNPTSFAIETNKIGGASGISRRGASKRKIDRETLERDGSCAGGIGASRGLRLFGTNAGGTGVKDGVHVVETWNTFEVLMCIE